MSRVDNARSVPAQAELTRSAEASGDLGWATQSERRINRETVSLLSAEVVDSIAIDRDVIQRSPGGFIWKDGKTSRTSGPDGDETILDFKDLNIDRLQIERTAMEKAIQQLEQQVQKLREQIGETGSE